MKITFPDGSGKEFKKGITGLEIAKSIGERLAMAAICIEVNGVLQDLSKPIEKDAKIRIITFKDKEGLEVFRHSSAHILGAAVTELFPYAKPTIGPAVEQGFYYDFAHEPFKPEDLEKINKKMEEIVKNNIPFERIELTKAEAKKLFKDNKYKLELIEEAEGNLSTYKLGKFVDLCRGPHVLSSGVIKAIRTGKIGSSYWKADAKNDVLQRIYGISFPDKKEMDNYVKMTKEALARDHTKLGKELDLFITSPLIGQGLPLFTPRGSTILRELKRWIEDEEEKRGYLSTTTPFMAKIELYKVSGHWDHYREGMFLMDASGEQMALRPMTCPYQFQIYNSKTRSYRDLPIRYSETSNLFRNEDSGEMHGLIRVRQFTISEGHLICRPDQLEIEFKGVLDLINYVFKTLGLTDYTYRFSRWDPNDKKGKYIDNPKMWELGEAKMKKILDESGIKYIEAIGEAAFYGPKLDIQMKNVYGKEDTAITVQFDFALPERFDMTYEGADGKKQRPVVIHRTSIGCYERTLALLIEHYAGKFPLWLSPVQVKILPIADRHLDYANKVAKSMKEHNIRVEVDARVESTPKKVRDAQLEQVNYILVVGDKEQQNNTVNVRTRDEVVHGEKKVDVLIKELLKEIQEKK